MPMHVPYTLAVVAASCGAMAYSGILSPPYLQENYLLLGGIAFAVVFTVASLANACARNLAGE